MRRLRAVRPRGGPPRDGARAAAPAAPPSAELQAAVAALAGRHGIEMIGLPLAEEIAEAA